MRKIIKVQVVLWLLLIIRQASAQILTPVKWSYGLKNINSNTYEVHLKADMDEGWHIYAQIQPNYAINQPTKIIFKRENSFQKIGKIKEVGKLEKYFNKDLGIGANQYANTVDFIQIIKLKRKGPIIISGVITYQTCTEKKCLPAEDRSFNISINAR